MLFIQQSRRTFTMIELAITLGIISVLTSIGIWAGAGMIPQWRTRAAAQQFASNVQKCRALAVQANAECRILLVDYDDKIDDVESPNIGEYWVALGNRSNNSDSWDLLPPDIRGADDTQGIVNLSEGSADYKRHVSIADWGSGIGGPNFGNNNAIVFGPRGFITNPVTDFSGEGYIDILFINKHSRSERQKRDYFVKITRSGMVRIHHGMHREYDGLWSGTARDSSAN
jgi:Tfp pilus assembly protein FimT